MREKLTPAAQGAPVRKPKFQAPAGTSTAHFYHSSAPQRKPDRLTMLLTLLASAWHWGIMNRRFRARHACAFSRIGNPNPLDLPLVRFQTSRSFPSGSRSLLSSEPRSPFLTSRVSGPGG